MSRSAYHCMLSIIRSSEYTEVVQNTNFLLGNDSTSILCNILTVLGAVLNNILPRSIAATLQPFKGHSLTRLSSKGCGAARRGVVCSTHPFDKRGGAFLERVR